MHTPEEFLAPDGRLAARVAGWESRPQQLEMAAVVTVGVILLAVNSISSPYVVPSLLVA